MLPAKAALLPDTLARWLTAMPARRKALWVGLTMMIGPITATAAILLLAGLDRMVARA